MNILIISPDYFDSISSLLINLITAGVSIASLIITLMMYKVAIKALDTWRNQKEYDIYIDIMKGLHPFQRTFGKYLVRYSAICKDDIDKKVKLRQLLDISTEWFEELKNLGIFTSFVLMDELPDLEKYKSMITQFKLHKTKYDEINNILLFAKVDTFDFDSFRIRCIEEIVELTKIMTKK